MYARTDNDPVTSLTPVRSGVRAIPEPGPAQQGCQIPRTGSGTTVPVPVQRQHRVRTDLEIPVDAAGVVDAEERVARIRHGIDHPADQVALPGVHAHVLPPERDDAGTVLTVHHSRHPVGLQPGAHHEVVALADHVRALLGYRERGAVAFEYGNGIRAQAAAHGVEDAFEIPGFVSAYVRPIFAHGVGPFRWICLSGDPADLRRSEDVVMEVVGTDSLRAWIELARERVPLQGLPARVCWLGLGQRDRVALALNELVRSGECGPLALGRDHMDPASVASPTRETEGMLDGSDAIADWPVLSALLNAAQGASWVAIGNGGGVGVGRSIHSGLVVVADGSELAERKLRRVYWTDPALGIARYVDAGYPEARDEAARHGLDLPG